MGTNFYWRTRICAACDRYDEHHVGKRSSGWSFSFRAYRHRLMNEQEPDWGYDEKSPFGRPISSRADWREVLAGEGELRDEYGEVVDDPIAWLDAHQPPTAERREWEDRQTEWSERYRYLSREERERDWRDPEGFRFYAGEFS